MDTEVHQVKPVANSNDSTRTGKRNRANGEAADVREHSEGSASTGSRRTSTSRPTSSDTAIAKGSNIPHAPELTGEKAVQAKLAYLDHLSATNRVTDALKVAGVTFEQLRRFRAEDPGFVSQEELARVAADDRLRSVVDDMIADRDRTIVSKAMNRLPEYNPAKQTEVKVSGSVEHKHIKDMSDEEKRALIAEAAAIDADWEEVDG